MQKLLLWYFKSNISKSFFFKLEKVHLFVEYDECKHLLVHE